MACARNLRRPFAVESENGNLEVNLNGLQRERERASEQLFDM